MLIFNLVSMLVSLTALSSYINYSYVKLPKSIGITFITLILSFFIIFASKMGYINHDKSLLDGIKFNDTFLHGMLSFLLFAGSMHVSVVELSRYRVLIASLATISIILSTFLVGIFLYILTQALCINLPIYFCVVFGALISPTDPIAVLGILKLIGAPRSLELKIAGEALFNDGMGIVLFFVILSIAYCNNGLFSFETTFFYFFRQGLGGLLIGLIIGVFTGTFLRRVNDPEVTIIITLGIVSGGYYISHSLMNISGPICMAMTGLVISNMIKRGPITEETVIRLGSFWELLDEVLNAMLFVLIGLEFMSIFFDISIIFIAIGVISVTLFGRWLSILVPIVTLAHFRRINFKLLNVLTWSGLRGGVSIALALSIEGFYHDFLVSITYIVVIFSMVVQGITVSLVIRWYIRRKMY